MRRLGRRFYARDPLELAPQLLHKVIVHERERDRRSARIVEVEAYCGSVDPGAHTYRGRTARNATMFGEPGLLYVYFSYGVHWCMNVVCGREGEGVAVLLRAAAPLEGIEAMRAARGTAARRDRDLGSGPGKLTQALGIDGTLDGIDLVADDRLWIADDGTAPSSDLVQTTRVGLSKGAEHPWRWYVGGDPNVSRR